MDPIIEIRDVSKQNRQPTKVFSTNIEINKTGHKMYHPSETHSRQNLVRKFGEDIGGLMFFLVRFPCLDHIYITSYSIVVALKTINDAYEWSPTIDTMINLSIKSLAEKQQRDSLIIRVEMSSNDPTGRWYSDDSAKWLTGISQQRFWRPMRSMSSKYLRVLGKPWQQFVPQVLKIPGVEEVEPFYNTFSVEIGDVYVPRWDHIEDDILHILTETFHQNVIIEHDEK
jgi:hypothetical protein